MRLCPSCGTGHSVLLQTRLGPRCIVCTRLERQARRKLSDVREIRMGNGSVIRLDPTARAERLRGTSLSLVTYVP